MKKYINPSREQFAGLVVRPVIKAEDLSALVKRVFGQVKNEGDKAIKEFTATFDKVEVNRLKVSEKEFEEAEKAVSKELKSAIRLAKNNIEKFHDSQRLEKQI